MEFGKIKHLWRRAAAFGISGMLALTLAACGGGGGSPGTTGGDTSTGGTITVELTNSAGAAANVISGADSLTVVAKVKNSAGAVAKNEVVTFSVSNDLATISPVSATALTDSTGVARVSLKSAGKGAGAATVTATATLSGATTAISGSANFAVGASSSATPVAVNFISATPSDKSIVIKGAGGNGRTEVALLTFKVVDSANVGIPGVSVNFATESTYAVTLISASGVSDDDGNISVSLQSGTQPTTVRVVATIAGTSISAPSDTITVTTGQPVQQAFSLSMAKFNPEGWNYDGETVLVTARLADAYGSSVADGTQVVFTTTAGAFSGDARCLTVNGECTVTWRSQNPRPTNGIGTIVATATNSTSTLTQSASFYMSGSFGQIHYPTTGGAVASIPTIDFGASCEADVIPFRLTDVNNNPMPQGTVVSINANDTGVTTTVLPTTVPNVGVPSDLTALRGTVHTLSIKPGSCDAAGTAVTSMFYIMVTSPKGNQTLVPVYIRYLKS